MSMLQKVRVGILILGAAFIGGLMVQPEAIEADQQRPVAAAADEKREGKVAPEAAARETSGSLKALDNQGQTVGLCPLKHTSVNAEVSGYVSRVHVTQKFHNPFEEKIEAVYTFPLPEDAAVDDMVMHVGDRTIKGKIKRRKKARRVYEAAKKAGHVASLLEQQRPNIFTQSVANIEPGEDVSVYLRYVQRLKFADGWFEFVYPTVVGPRYIPGKPISAKPEVPPQQEGKAVEVPGPKQGPEAKGTGWSPDTDRVPDASQITPPVTAPDTRSGHDISIEMTIDAGATIHDLKCPSHDITARHRGRVAVINLKDEKTIPNRDFIIRYTVAEEDVSDCVLSHASDRGRFFAIILQPPRRVKPEQVAAKEMVFVLDTSGSMSGKPIEKAKTTMMYCLDNLNPDDTFNFITFAGHTHVMFDEPVKATAENVGRVQKYLANRRGGGGTEMMKAVKAALEPSDDADHLRIVCFMTDGYVGNDMAIIDEIQRHPNARVFSFGVGSSPNRYLLDNMAGAGRGEADYLSLKADEEKIASSFYERLRYPVLTDIKINWHDLPVKEIYPKRIHDLFSSKPVVVLGRYSGRHKGVCTLHGRLGGKPLSRNVQLRLLGRRPAHEVLGPLWARKKIEHLMHQDLRGIQHRRPRSEIKTAIVDLGLKFRLVTQFTSFVAVEQMRITEGDTSRTIAVPVEMPEGVSYEGVFGRVRRGDRLRMKRLNAPVGAAGVGAMQAAPVGAGGPRGPAGGAPRQAEGLAGGPPAPESPPAPPEKRRQRLLKSRLANPLRGLAQKVKQQGENGNLKLEKVQVTDGMIEITVWMTELSPDNIEAVKKVGFKLLARAKAAKMVVGKIDVEKLQELALLECVRFVEPTTQ